VKPSRLAFILVCAVAVFASDSPDTREITDPKTIASLPTMGAAPIPVDDLFFTRSVGGGAWSPDGKEIVFTTNLTGRNNLWKVSASGGWPIQLSQSDDRQSGAAWSPDGKWIVFQSDLGGGEIYDLFAIPSNGGAVVNLTNTPEISETSAQWSPDGKFLAIQYKPKTSPSTDVAIMDWATRAVRNVTNEKTQDHLWNAGMWSPDGKYIYSTRFNAGFSDADVYRINAATGEKEN
jgi:Tol biopolymer transport system component